MSALRAVTPPPGFRAPNAALITGASSGLGAEYARALSARGMRVILVARDKTALSELAKTLPGESEVLVADLLRSRGVAKVVRRLLDEERPVDLLVNNAGFGLPLDFATNDIGDEERHLDLLVRVPMQLMHAALGAMRSRGGIIINVASIAGFMPRSTYGACKGWLISFSRWANDAYPNVTTTAVCPGFTHTQFHERMGLAPGNEGVADWMWLDAPFVIESSLRDVARGKSVSVPSVRYKTVALASRFLPAGVLARLGARGR